MEKIAEVNDDILVLDTKILSDKGSHLQIHYESLDDPRNAVDYSLVLIPTKRAVFDIVQQFGYFIIMLKPRFKDYTGANGISMGQEELSCALRKQFCLICQV